MMRGTHRQAGYVAALCHRVSGIAVALFLPLHFLALGSALEDAAALDNFLRLTDNAFVKLSEAGLVVALASHMALGLRILAIEFLGLRERTGTAFSACAGVALVFGFVFLLNAS